LPKRSLPSFSTRRAATLTPRSAWISASSSSSSVCWSSFFLVKRPVMLSVTRLVDFARPERSRDSQPFFSASFSTSSSGLASPSSALGASLASSGSGVSLAE
jgi:hypothetical protein